VRAGNFWITVFVIVLGSVAWADKSPKPRTVAKQHYQAGKTAYNIHDWDEAIGEFKAAYKVVPDPVFLFNIAQAYRLKGDCKTAAEFYTTYRREEKNKKLRDSTDKVLHDMEACAKTAPSAATTGAAKTTDVGGAATAAPTTGADPNGAETNGTATDPPTVGVTIGGTSTGGAQTSTAGSPVVTTGENAIRGPLQGDPHRTQHTWGKIVFWGGIGFLALAGVEAGYASSLQCKQNLIGTCSDGRDFNRLSSDHRHATSAAKGLAGLGSACIVVGAVLYLTGRNSASSDLAVVPTAHGAAVVGSF